MTMKCLFEPTQLSALGYDVVEIDCDRFRIDDRFDLYAPRWRWFDNQTAEHGQGVASLIAHMQKVAPQ